MARNRQRARDRKQKLHRENVPGSLDNASGDVDEVEARIVAGAAGIPLEDVDDDGGLETDPEEALDREQLAGGAAHPARRPSGSRLVNFIRASWAELQRVQWPNRQALTTLTGVVLGFVLLAGGYLGLLDAIFNRLIQAIL